MTVDELRQKAGERAEAEAEKLEPQAERPRPICGRVFLQHLWKVGIIPGEATRVVIEADCKGMLRIYVEQIGTDGVLKVVTPETCKGAEIIVV